MDRRLFKPSIYSFKSKTPVIPKLSRMSIQKLRELKKLKLQNQFRNQQHSTKMQDCNYVAESHQQYFENRILYLDNQNNKNKTHFQNNLEKIQK